MNRGALFSLAGLVALLLVGSDLAMAQVDLHEPSRAFSGLLELIRNNANQWSSRLQGYARQLFWSLVVIDLVLVFGPLVLRNADFGELMEAFVKFVLIVGFFASLLIFSVQWSEAIVNSFRQAGASAAGVGFQLTPGDMFSLGVELAYTVSDVGTGFNPGLALAIAGSALIILVCFAFIAAFMAVTLVESYVVINASVLLMGLGGSKFTREHAISILRYSLSVGVKLFVLTLIVGLIMESARNWQAAYQHDNTSMWTMVGLALVCAVLAKSIPDQLQALINGVSPGGGGVIGGMAAAGAAFGAGAMAGMHSAMQSSGILGGAGKSVSDLLKSYGGSSGPGASMNSMNSSGQGSGGSQRAGAGSRVGGGLGAAQAPGAASSASQPGFSQGSASKVSGGSGSSTANVGSGTSSASSSKSGMTPASMAHAATEMGMRAFGTGMSIAVPGAEGSESLSVGPPPTPPGESGTSGASGSMDTPENIIRPASNAPVGANPVEPVQAHYQPIDTMSGLQEALNNRGKLP